MLGCDSQRAAEEKTEPSEQSVASKSRDANESDQERKASEENKTSEEQKPSSWRDEVDLTMDGSTPENALRSFLKAMAASDLKLIKAICLDRDGIETLVTSKEELTDFQSKIMFDMAEKTRLKTYNVGDSYSLPTGRKVDVSTDMVNDNRSLMSLPGSPMPLPVVKIDGSWKVDPESVIAVRRAAAMLGESKAQ